MRYADVQTKLDVIAGNLDRLADLPKASFEEFAGDFRNVYSALHLLQTSVQALMDVAAYVVSSLGLRTPSSSVDVFEVLREAGHMTADRAAVYAKMVQFRNRVVHLYNRISHQVIYEILTTETSDLRECRDRLVDIIDAHPDAP